MVVIALVASLAIVFGLTLFTKPDGD